MQIPTWFVIVIGLVIVFVGLISLILICSIMGAICKRLIKEEPTREASAPAVSSGDIPNKQELLAAVAAAVAEELGEDVSAIRITSIRRI